MGQVYLITNKINKKQYVGVTINTAQSRWEKHVEDALTGNRDNSLLHKAIKKYGQQNFQLEVLEDCSSEKLFEREKYYIAVKGTYYLNGKGYNLTLGGEGTLKYSDDAILRLWAENKTQKEIAKELGAQPNTISERMKILCPNETRRGQSFHQSLPVEQYDLYGNYIATYGSLREAANSTKTCSESISKCCSRQRTNCGNYLWKYCNDSTSIEDIVRQYAASQKCNAVDEINEQGIIIRTFSSGALAEKELKLPRGKVSEVCNHKYGRKTVRGHRFQWHHPIKRKLLAE